MNCVQLEDLTLEQVEAALAGSASALTVITPDWRWSSIELGPLSIEDRDAIASARRIGYLVASGADPWSAWHVWRLTCLLAGQPAVCAWQRPGRKSMLELQLPGGAELGTAAGPMWAMAAEYAERLSGGPGWFIAEQTGSRQVQQLAAAVASMAKEVLECAA